MRLDCERLESRTLPATLDLSGGLLTFTGDAGNDAVTLAVSGGVYSVNDSTALIALGSGAVAAGYRGSGTHTVSGPESVVDAISVNPGDGTNVVNVKSCHDPLTVDGGPETTTVNLNSVAPSMIGNLSTITAAATVNAGADTRLNASDYLGVSRPNPIVVSSTAITGLAANPIYLSGTFTSLRVWGSNAIGLAESYVIDSPPATYFRLDCNGGADDVHVTGDTTGDIYLGAGDDTFTVDAGVTLTGNVYGGAGSNTYYYGPPEYGTVTGTVG